jgi:hypothetical protein
MDCPWCEQRNPRIEEQYQSTLGALTRFYYFQKSSYFQMLFSLKNKILLTKLLNLLRIFFLCVPYPFPGVFRLLCFHSDLEGDYFLH